MAETRRQKLSKEKINHYLQAFPDWKISGNALERVFEGSTYQEALDLLYAIGQLAEKADHHPDLSLHYKTLSIRFWTHTAGGITPLDIEMASQTEALLKQV